MLKPLKLLPEVSPPFELKGSLFTLTVLHLYEANHEIIARYLVEKIRQAPGFFRNTPLVVDLEALTEADADVDFISLSKLLRTQGLVPVGVRNGSPALQAAAVLAGLPVLPDGRSAAAVKKLDKLEHYPPVGRSKIITQPVRSGQQIYAADGDLILLGAISAGAEVLADGNIHSYGPLRGRALAGVKGDTEARIFCQSLAAELVSIAGHYRIIEQLDEAEQGKPVQLFLSEDHLIIEPLLR